MPNLTKLKNIINTSLDSNILQCVSFIHSNEILFNKHIPLDTYCKCIVNVLSFMDHILQTKKDNKNNI